MTFICNTIDEAIGMAWVISPGVGMEAVFHRILELNATHGKGWAVNRLSGEYDEAYFARRFLAWVEEHNALMAEVHRGHD
jgi:hypothetical protein